MKEILVRYKDAKDGVEISGFRCFTKSELAEFEATIEHLKKLVDNGQIDGFPFFYNGEDYIFYTYDSLVETYDYEVISDWEENKEEYKRNERSLDNCFFYEQLKETIKGAEEARYTYFTNKLVSEYNLD